MAKSPTNFADFNLRLKHFGLICFGGLELSENECAKGYEGFVGQKALLIGNAGPDMWRELSLSAEYGDGAPNPMNRWTKRVLDVISDDYEARAVYPFDEPYWPFQRLAQKAIGVKASPLGILMHPEYGLWHAFRGLLIFSETHEFVSQINVLIQNAQNLIHPCDTCEEKPCLTACPVDAFTGERLEVDKCFTHLDDGAQPHCMSLGCQAAQVKFHMKAYRY